MTKKTKQTYNILLESELENNQLTIEDIKNDIKRCKRMINRAKYKTILYKRKLHIINHIPNNETSLIKKGLSLFNITKKYSKTI